MNWPGLKTMSPDEGAAVCSKILDRTVSVREYAESIKKMGLSPIGHMDEWAEYGIAAIENRERV